MDTKFAESLKFWKQTIWAFFNTQRPDLVDKPTVAYFRFLEWRGLLTKDEADKLAGYASRKEFCPPETFVRCRREGIEKGVVAVSNPQRQMFQAESRATRQQYRDDKKDNPIYDKRKTPQ